jgi:hypothetical protein
MTTHLVTFSDESMSRARELCVESAKRNGVDSAREWSRDEIMRSNYADEERWLTLELMGRGERGAGGWWCWKPYVIHDTLCQTSGGYIIYADAGIEFIAPIQPIIDRMNQDIFLFGNNYEHAHWCKRDVISYVWPMSVEEWRQRWWSKTDKQRQEENPDLVHWERYHRQAQASVIFFRVSDYSRQFVAEWLKWCLFEGGRLIDDSPSRLPNHPEFREHRHDQAILTTLAYREGIRLRYWPAMYNDGAFVYEKLPYYAGDDYPIMFHHHRRRDHEWK